MISDILITKLANDAGYDLEFGERDGWLQFGVGGSQLRAWISSQTHNPVVCLSRLDIAKELDHGVPWAGSLPPDAVDARQVVGPDALISILSRARVLDRTLPQAMLHEYQAAVLEIDKTEALALVAQRRGQDIFRKGLMEYWQGRCAISGLAVPELLRASHAKPWKDSTDAERLDVHNGLLLAAHLDAAFDLGLITVTGEGVVQLSSRLDDQTQMILGLNVPMVIKGVRPAHERYLSWHRTKVFQSQ